MRIGGIEFTYPRGILVGLAVLTLVGLVVAAGTSSAAFGVYNRAWDGASDLRAQAEAVNATHEVARNTTVYERADPNETIAVVLAPDREYRAAAIERMRSFVTKGGTLVVADDFGAQGNALLAGMGAQARIDGRLVRDERYHYRSPTMPVARNVSNHSYTSGVEAMTVNHGSVVHPNGADPLVSSSGFAYLDTNRNGAIDDTETLSTYPVATVESVGAGRVVVVSDPSALINIMLERPGNRAFVRALFRAHDHVVLDYSHTPLPPLMVAVLALRDSLALQLVVGIAGIGAIALVGRRPGWLAAVRSKFGDSGPPARPGMDRASLLAFVEQRYPEWDRERAVRVVEGLLRDRD